MGVDPRARFEMVSREMKGLKEVDQAGGIENLLRFLGRLPAPIQAALGKRLTAPNIFTNLLCTNVRGPETPLYCLGHEMVAHYPWVLVTWRMGLGVAVMSYMKNLWFSFTGDATLPDLDRIADFLAEDFWELHDAVVKRSAVAKRATVPAVTSPEQAKLAVVAQGRADELPAWAVTVVRTGDNRDAPGSRAGSTREGTGEDGG